MGKWKHRLTNINPENRRADCLFCGNNVVIKKTYKKYGNLWACRVVRNKGKNSHHQIIKRRDSYKYRKYFINLDLFVCSNCKIEYKDIRFFDVNHINGDHDDNKINNLELLCPNCHRLETIRQWKDHEMTKYNRNFTIDRIDNS